MKRSLILFFLVSLNLPGKPDLPQPLQFNYHDVPLRQVLEDLSDRIGIRFVFYDQLVETRSVSCRFSSRSVASILNRIILPQGLSYERTSGNVFTLYRRSVPPHTWILQGQVLSGDSSGIENAAVFLTELSIGALTDAQGCFVFMDVPVSPCQILISHPMFESLGRSADSTQVYQIIVLTPRPIEGLILDRTGTEIRTMKKRNRAAPLPEEKLPVTQEKVWPPAMLLFRTGTPLVSLHSPLNLGTDPFSCAGLILYDGIPWLVNACAFEMSGFHSLNTGHIRSGISHEGCSACCEQVEPPVPDRRISSTVEWVPWQVKGRFLWSVSHLTLFVASGRSVFLSGFHPFYEACEDYQQLTRYRSIRPVRSPIYRHSDFSSKIIWNVNPADRLSLTMLQMKDRLNTAFDEAVADPETMTDRTGQTGARLAWRHQWSRSAQSGAEVVFSENWDRYLYQNEPFISGKFTDRADFSTGYGQIVHQQPVNSWWHIRLAGGLSRTKSVQKLEATRQTVAAMHSERTVFYVNASQRLAPFVLLEGILNTGARYDPDTHTAVLNPALMLRYRVRQPLILGAEWAEIQADWLSVPNQYLTDQPWRVRTFRMAAGSGFPAEKIRRFVLSLESTAPQSFHASLFYHELTGLLYGTGSSGEVLPSGNRCFISGSGTSYGSQFEAEVEANAFDFWISYQWTKTRHHLPSLNGNRDFIPEWHRDHVIRGLIQASPFNMDLRLTGIWAGGSVFIKRLPVYQMTAYGPDYRLTLPSGAWETEHSSAYFRMDGSVEKRIPFKGTGLILGLTVINLLNRTNVIGPYYFLESSDADALLPRTFLNMPDLPRTAFFTVRVDFFR
jgi:hypothetical protein